MSTAALENTALETVKNYKGGWKDPGLRSANARVNLSQPLERPSGLNESVWSKRPQPEVINGWMKTTTGETAFAICDRCLGWNGQWAKINEDGSPGEIHGVLGDRDCPCPSKGTTLLDIDPVPLPTLGINGIALSVLIRAGIETTHDAEVLGWRGLEAADGIGPGSVKALRTAIHDANLPELRAGDWT